MTGLLSDAWRRVVLSGAVASLLAFMVGQAAYASLVPQQWDAVQADPATWDGQEILLSLFTIEAIDGPDRYVLRHGNWTVPVVGPTADLRLGSDMTVKGPYRASDGVVVETFREFAPYRTGKKILGLGSIVVLAALWPSLFARRDHLLVSRA